MECYLNGRSSSVMIFFNPSIFLLVFCGLVSTAEGGVWKSLTKSVDFFFSLCSLFSFCFMCLEILLFGTYISKIIMSSWWIDRFYQFMFLLSLVVFLALKCASSYIHSHSSFLLISTWMTYLSYPFNYLYNLIWSGFLIDSCLIFINHFYSYFHL